MTFEDIKQISIREYLAKIGITPKRENERKGMFLSPLRNERNASFSVDYIDNLWYDHGLGEGGSIIDLVSRMENCSVRDAIRRLENNAFSFHRNSPANTKVPVLKAPSIQITKVKPLSHPDLLSYLENKRHINIEMAKKHCCEVHYSLNNKTYYSIGFINDTGGYELRNEYYKGCTSKNISSIKIGSNICQIFEGFIDYLSYLTMKNQQNPDIDTIVLNSVSNVPKLENNLSGYERIIAYLDNDEAGKKAIVKLESFHKFVENKSSLYSPYKDVNEFLCNRKINPVKEKKNSPKLYKNPIRKQPNKQQRR